MDEMTPPTDILLRDIPANVAQTIAREAKRQRRSRMEQLSIIIEQAAARIERAERRTAQKQAAQQETA